MLKRIYIEISNICNLQCTFCPVVERDKKVMSLSDFKRVLSEASPLAEEVCLHLMGEPLAHPEFSKILNVCEEAGTQIQLTTNGVVIEKKAVELLNSKVIRQINFSIQAYKDNFPDRPLKSYFDPIFEFTKKAFDTRPELYINFRLWNQHDSEVAAEENEEFYRMVEESFDLELNRNIQVESIKSKKLVNRLYLHFDSRFEWPSFDLPPQGEIGKCHALISHIGIHADGTVVPCCFDKEANIPLGNCLEEYLVSILNSERAMAMKTGFQNNRRVEKFCQHCTFINRFSK